MSWILGCLALACFGWAATLALLIRAMEERDQARDSARCSCRGRSEEPAESAPRRNRGRRPAPFERSAALALGCLCSEVSRAAVRLETANNGVLRCFVTHYG